MTKARDLASAAPAPSTVSATELGYLDGVSSAIQTQIDGKSGTAHNHDGTYATSAHNHNSDYIANTLTNTTGDIIYASGANTPARLGIGSTGNVLTVSGGIPSWAAPAGGGKVLQVVQGTSTSELSSSSATFADTNLSATITPSSASSKVLVFAMIAGAGKSDANAANRIDTRILRGATSILLSRDMVYTNTTLTFNAVNIVMNYLDSPATTSATTYKTQFASAGGTASVKVGNGGVVSTIILMEIGA